MLKLTIHKADAPSYRAAVLELPEREDLLAEKLERIGVGVTLEKNCQVDKLEGDGGALQALVGTCVNADEMQYLAKRMDSFDAKELLTFRAAAAVEKPTEVKDLINLTFNLHCYTVITDFSDVAGIGRNHLLSKRIALSGNELAATDCEAIGRALISGGDGVVTPYGVLYRNGNEPELVYNGWQFPEYFYQECEAALVLSTDKDFKVSETLCFPCFEVETKKALLRLGVTEADKCYTKLEAYHICGAVLSLFERNFVLAEHLDALNDLARCCQGFDEQAEKNYQAIVEYASPADPLEALLLAQNFWEFTVIPGVHTPEEYGRHMIEDSGHFDLDPNLADYMDFQGYGQQRVQKEKGVFTDYGYITYRGCTTLVEDILEQNVQADQCQQMGGM